MRGLVLAAVSGLFCFCYGYHAGEQSGHDAGELACLAKLNEKETELTSRCMARIDALEKDREELNEMVTQYVSRIATLRHKSTSLQLHIEQLQSSGSCAVADSSESATAGVVSGGRSEAMGSILKEATELIRERDEIAESYNELRKKCQLK